MEIAMILLLLIAVFCPWLLLLAFLPPPPPPPAIDGDPSPHPESGDWVPFFSALAFAVIVVIAITIFGAVK